MSASGSGRPKAGPDVSQSRLEMLRRADEALERAMRWLDWMQEDDIPEPEQLGLPGRVDE